MRQLGTILIEMESVVNKLSGNGSLTLRMMTFVDRCHEIMITRLWYDTDQRFIDELGHDLTSIYESIMKTPDIASDFYDALGLMVEFLSTMKVLDRTC